MSVFIASYFEMQLSHYHFPIVYDVDSLLRQCQPLTSYVVDDGIRPHVRFDTLNSGIFSRWILECQCRSWFEC